MDPISFAASIIALVGVVVKTGSALGSIIQHARQMPDEILELNNETQSLILMLRELKEIADSQTLEPSPGLIEAVERAQNRIQKLEEFVRQLPQVAPFNTPNMASLKWKHKRAQAHAIQADLKGIKSDIAVFLGVNNLSIAGSLKLCIQDFITTTTERSEHHGDFVENMFCEQQKTSSRIIEILKTTERHTTRRIKGAAEYKLGFSRKPGLPFYDNDSTKEAATLRPLGIRVVRFSDNLCPPACSCSCHAQSRLQTPDLLSQLVGSLFVGYSGQPFRQVPCDYPSCRNQTSFSAHLTYYFPRWLTLRVFSLQMLKTTQYPYVYMPKMRWRVPDDAKIFSLVQRQDLVGVQTIIQRGLGSPTDLRDKSGVTPLNYAIYCGSFNLCKMLLDYGSDPYYEDGSGCTPMARAWTAILRGGRHASEEDRKQLQILFPDKDCLVERQFSDLQKIILGLLGRDLRQELQKCTISEINYRDKDGLTALAWAATRGDEDSVRLLLAYQADPNIASNQNRSPLHWAVEAPNLGCIEALVDAHANVNLGDQWGLTPLTDVCWGENDPCYAKALFVRELEIDKKAKSGKSALAYTATQNNDIMAEFLLNCGAQIDSEDNSGFTPLLHSVIYGSDKVLATLLRHKPNVAHRDNKHNTLLHHVADYGRTSTIRVLLEAQKSGKLSDIGVAWLNADGLTAKGVLETRHTVLEEEFTVKFEELLHSIVHGASEHTIEIAEAISEVGSDDSFYDAFEQLMEVKSTMDVSNTHDNQAVPENKGSKKIVAIIPETALGAAIV